VKDFRKLALNLRPAPDAVEKDQKSN
jgi:hypothetical protein